MSVVDLQWSHLSRRITWLNRATLASDRYFNTKHEYEKEFTDRIANALLSFVKDAVISVNVELHPELEEIENTTRVDPKTVPIDRSETSKTLNSTASQPSGRPGVAGQGE